MKNIVKLFCIFMFSILLVNTTFALEKVINFTESNITDSSVDFSWDADPDAYVYEIHYGTKPILEEEYALKHGFIEKEDFKVIDLNPETTYYFSIKSLNELGDASEFSDEIVLNTIGSTVEENIENKIESGSGTEVETMIILKTTGVEEETITEPEEIITEESKMPKSDFGIIDAFFNGTNTVKLEFTNKLEDKEDSIRNFNVVSVTNDLDTYAVVDTIVTKEENILIITLDTEPIYGDEYKVEVIDIKDTNGNSIEFGIDSEATFVVDDTELNSAAEEIVEEELGSAEVIVSGVDLSEEEVNNNILNVASESNKLPKTGPEQILLFILAMIFGALVFVFKFKKG